MENPSALAKKTAIVLLSYNSLELVKKFLPRILNTIPDSPDVRLVLVDNASTDGTASYVSDRFPQVEIITIKENHGFTNGYVESLAQIKADNYVLISSDIEVSEGWFEPAIELLNSSDDIAAVQPKIMSYDRRDEFEYAGAAGGYIDNLGFPFCRGRMINVVEKDRGQYDDVCEIFWASGACLFIKAGVYHQAGGLDNDFYAHMEEIDLCWRMKGRGYRIMFQPESIIYHMGGFIIKYGSPPKIFRNHRNNLIMLIKNLPGNELLWKLPLRVFLDYVAMATMIADGNMAGAGAVLKAHGQIIRHWGKWWKKRIAVQKHVKVKKPAGIAPFSLIWQFYIEKKRKFSDLNWKP